MTCGRGTHVRPRRGMTGGIPQRTSEVDLAIAALQAVEEGGERGDVGSQLGADARNVCFWGNQTIYVLGLHHGPARLRLMPGVVHANYFVRAVPIACAVESLWDTLTCFCCRNGVVTEDLLSKLMFVLSGSCVVWDITPLRVHTG